MSNSPLKVRQKSPKRGLSLVERIIAMINRKRRQKGGYINKRRKLDQQD